MIQASILFLHRLGYERVIRPILFRKPPQVAHDRLLSLLSSLDRSNAAISALNWIRRQTLPATPVEAGGITLDVPLILAAGFVKGAGFDREEAAINAVGRGVNIIPGWRSVPALVGAVEFGSFTRRPRAGNTGEVMWRDARRQSLQNRVGLKNPGARAAAEFLGAHAKQLPKTFGINLAAAPEHDNAPDEARGLVESLQMFLERGVKPTWLTINLSCPNVAGDPENRQTEEHARSVCSPVVDALRGTGIPCWVKLGPGLAASQYHALLRSFAEIGVRAIVATNTQPAPVPGDPSLTAGVSGTPLGNLALSAVTELTAERDRLGSNIDVIACGGILDGTSCRDYTDLGVRAMQYWTALVFRGPLAAATILSESKRQQRAAHA